MPKEPEHIPTNIHPTHSDKGGSTAIPGVRPEAALAAPGLDEGDYLVNVGETFGEWMSLEDEAAFSHL